MPILSGMRVKIMESKLRSPKDDQLVSHASPTWLGPRLLKV
jgi:hypothetical protein